MRIQLKVVCIPAVVLALAPLASAGTACTAGTLTTYEALGAAGCTIGTNTIYDFVTLTGSTGATPISNGNIDITPSGGTTDPTLMITVSDTASSTQTFEAIFDYRISGNTYTSDSITLSGSSESGFGGVTDLQNYCIGGSWDPTGVTTCSGSGSGGLATVDGFQNTDSSSLTGASLLAVTDDIEIDGPATGAIGTDSFTAVSAAPEPETWYLFAAGAAMIAIFKLRRERNQHA